ncbi:hypothetical protein ACGFMK_24390 [Amycolatopsis sp. NPDC049252]|uniref:nSTAND1 domain-containing NTPase n=1 Tax=Amycolatopsis sp. NPDC049252 TaxID=3363933 RepID=UPI0037246A62
MSARIAVETTAQTENPFPGPSAYRRIEQKYFFGRTEETEELTSFVLSSSATLLYAPSGTGKSSLLQAGVLPYLEKRFGVAVLPVVRMGPAPRAGTAHVDNEFVRMVIDAIGSDDAESVPDIAAAAARWRSDNSSLVLLVLDQFEEVFADPSRWRQRDEFFTVLRKTLADHTWLRVIIALRSDYLAELVPHEQNLPDHLTVRYQLEPLGRDRATGAIWAAFEATGVELGKGDLERVMELLLDSPRNPTGQLEHVNAIQLQIVCRQLWSERAQRKDPMLGGAGAFKLDFTLDTAIVHFVDEAITRVVTAGHVDELSLRWWLGHRLLTSAGRRAFLQVGEDLTAGLPNTVVNALAEAKLVQVEHRQGAQLAELTHDSMADAVAESNDVWLRRRNRRRYRRAAVLLALLAFLLALFPTLRQTTGDHLLDQSGVLGTEPVGASFKATETATLIRANVAPGDLRIKLTVLGSSGSPIGTRAFEASMGGDASLVVETVPNSTYKIALSGEGKEQRPYRIQADPLPLAKLTDDAVTGLSTTEVAIPIPAAGSAAQLLTVEHASLSGVSGARLLAIDERGGWAVVRAADPAALAAVALQDAVTGGAPTDAIVRRRVLPDPVPLRRDAQTKITVTDAVLLSYEAGKSQAPLGLEGTCTGSAQLSSAEIDDTTGEHVLRPFLGAENSMIPLPTVPGKHTLVLGSYDATIDCVLTIRSFGSPALGPAGSQVLVLPDGVPATAYPILPAEDTVFASSPRPDGLLIDLRCPSSSPLVADPSQRLLALVLANQPCALWLSRKAGGTGELRLGLRTAPATTGGGG